MFGRATITFGIGPHSSYYYNNTRFIIITVIYYYPLNVNAQLFCGTWPLLLQTEMIVSQTLVFNNYVTKL